MIFKDPWQKHTDDILSGACCACDRILSQDYGVLYCQYCWQKPAAIYSPLAS
ncbi:MAG: hypothetical protein ACFCU8_15235 [Thermosynechococcaceae cyanobacterium]